MRIATSVSLGKPGFAPARWRCLVVLVLWTVPLSGCSHLGNWLDNGFKVGPDYCKPAAPVADDWIDAGHFNDRSIISHGVDEVEWWRQFQDPFIDVLVQDAYRQNLPLRVAALRVLEAQAERGIAVGFLLPQFQQAFGQYNRIQLSKNGNPLGVQGIPVRAFDLWNAGFTASWELDVWGKLRRAIESADANLEAEVENYDDVLVCLIAETAATYVEMQTIAARLGYAHRNVVIQRALVRYQEANLREGEVDKRVVTFYRSLLEETQALIPALERDLRQANNRLCVLLGLPPRDLVPDLVPQKLFSQIDYWNRQVVQPRFNFAKLIAELLVEPLAVHVPEPRQGAQIVVGIPAELLRRRPDIRKAERLVAAGSARIGIATADLFPAFSINGTINWQSTKLSTLFEPASNAGILTPQFNWDILNYGRIVNNVRVQDARFQQLAIQYQQTALNANKEVEDAITAYLKSQEVVANLVRSERSTRETIELEIIRVREGEATPESLYLAMQDLVVRQDRLATAQGDVAISLIGLYKRLGGGWQIRLHPDTAPGLVPPTEVVSPVDADAAGQVAPSTMPVPRLKLPPQPGDYEETLP